MKYKLLDNKLIEEVIEDGLLLFYDGNVFVYREEENTLSCIGNMVDGVFLLDLIRDYKWEPLYLAPFRDMYDFLTFNQIRYEVI